MGSLFKGPDIPSKSAEQIAEEKRVKDQIQKDKDDEAKRQADVSRKQRANLLGSRSLQDENISGYGGFRRMGTTPSQGKSIRN